MADKILDVRGLRCPEPLMMVRRNMRFVAKNKTLLVIADDPSTKNDIPNLCFFMNYVLLVQKIKSLPYCYLIKK